MDEKAEKHWRKAASCHFINIKLNKITLFLDGPDSRPTSFNQTWCGFHPKAFGFPRCSPLQAAAGSNAWWPCCHPASSPVIPLALPAAGLKGHPVHIHAGALRQVTGHRYHLSGSVCSIWPSPDRRQGCGLQSPGASVTGWVVHRVTPGDANI